MKADLCIVQPPLTSPVLPKFSRDCLDVIQLVERDPLAWRRWLDWLPKICLPAATSAGSPFTSPANTSLQQRVFLDGTAVEVPLK